MTVTSLLGCIWQYVMTVRVSGVKTAATVVGSAYEEAADALSSDDNTQPSDQTSDPRAAAGNGLASGSKLVFFDIMKTGDAYVTPPDDVRSSLLQPAHDAGARVFLAAWSCQDVAWWADPRTDEGQVPVFVTAMMEGVGFCGGE